MSAPRTSLGFSAPCFEPLLPATDCGCLAPFYWLLQWFWALPLALGSSVRVLIAVLLAPRTRLLGSCSLLLLLGPALAPGCWSGPVSWLLDSGPACDPCFQCQAPSAGS